MAVLPSGPGRNLSVAVRGLILEMTKLEGAPGSSTDRTERKVLYTKLLRMLWKFGHYRACACRLLFTTEVHKLIQVYDYLLTQTSERTALIIMWFTKWEVCEPHFLKILILSNFLRWKNFSPCLCCCNHIQNTFVYRAHFYVQAERDASSQHDKLFKQGKKTWIISNKPSVKLTTGIATQQNSVANYDLRTKEA